MSIPRAAALIVLLGIPSAITAAPTTLFACTIGTKRVSVSAEDDRLVYRYGRIGARPEIEIAGTRGSGTVLWMTQHYTGAERQMRFVNGNHSYIVFTVDGNAQTGIESYSGVTVLAGGDMIAHLACRDHATFARGYDYDSLPRDDEAYTAL